MVKITEQVISIVHLYFSRKLRHVSKGDEVKLSWVYEVIDSGLAKLIY